MGCMSCHAGFRVRFSVNGVFRGFSDYGGAFEEGEEVGCSSQDVEKGKVWRLDERMRGACALMSRATLLPLSTIWRACN